MTEPIDIRLQNLVQGLTLMISWTSLMVKVIGQRSRSSSWKSNFGVLAWVFCPIIDINACKGFMCTEFCAHAGKFCGGSGLTSPHISLDSVHAGSQGNRFETPSGLNATCNGLVTLLHAYLTCQVACLAVWHKYMARNGCSGKNFEILNDLTYRSTSFWHFVNCAVHRAWLCVYCGVPGLPCLSKSFDSYIDLNFCYPVSVKGIVHLYED